MNVSYFKTITETNGGVEISINDAFEAVISGEWSHHVEKVREGKTKDERTNLKKTVPYFTTSGTFKNRSLSGLIKHSGLIAIDFDNLIDVNEVKSYLAFDQYSYFTSVSIGGEGLCVIVKIDPEKHLESFKFLSEYYLKNYNLEVDQACKDIPRPRFVMHDADAILHDSAVRLNLEKERDFDAEKIIGIAENMIRKAPDGKRHNELLKASRLMGGYIGGGLLDENTVTARLVSVWYEKVFNKEYNYTATINDGISNGILSPITFEHYNKTTVKTAENKKQIAVIFAKAREINRAGRTWENGDLMDLLRTGVDVKEIEKIFKKVFDEEGHFFGYDHMPKHVKMELAIDEKWEFRKNVVLGSTDYRIKANRLSMFEKVNYDTVTRYALHCGLSTSVDKVRSLLRSDFVTEYDPLKSYFLDMDKWDEKTDHIAEFAKSVKTKNDEFFLSMFKKHLVRSVAQIMNEEVNRYVFVLVGEKQATGKSTFIRSLSPFPKGQYYTEAKVKDDKDGQFSFAENFIYNIEELSDMKNSDANRLKAIISQSLIKERRPYQAEVESMPRRCTFFGSTNNSEFLTDTENTRWICNEVTAIDWNYSKLDISLLWSQAYALLNDPNFNMFLDQNELDIQSVSNKDYEVTTEATETIIQHFKPAIKEDPFAQFLTATEILQKIDTIIGGAVKFRKSQITTALKSLGYTEQRQRREGKFFRGYFVVQEQIEAQPFKPLKPNYNEN